MESAIVSREDVALAEIREAMNADGEVRFQLVRVFFGPAKQAVQIEAKPYSGRWKKVGPLLFAPDGQDVLEVFRMLLEMREA